MLRMSWVKALTVSMVHDIPMFILSFGISQRQVRLWWVATPIAQYPCLNIKTMSHRIGHQTQREAWMGASSCGSWSMPVRANGLRRVKKLVLWRRRRRMSWMGCGHLRWYFENGRRKVTWAAGKGSHKTERSSGLMGKAQETQEQAAPDNPPQIARYIIKSMGWGWLASRN